MGKPLQVFCCYAREDQSFLYELKKHLMSLQREGLITVQADIDVSPGMEWERAIHHHLEAANIILLLVSPNFIASDYCFAKEMQQAMARHERGVACVVPVIIRPTSWEQMPFSKLQALPENARPVSSWQDRDEAFLNITGQIRLVVQELTRGNRVQQETLRQQPAGLLIPATDLSALNKKIACPFCFHKCFVIDLCFRCEWPYSSGRAPDEVYAKARGFALQEMGRVLTPNKGVFSKFLECEACKIKSVTRICPVCHFELSSDLGQVDQCFLSIIGGLAAGKSHYLASLIACLLKYEEMGKDFNLTVQMIGKETHTKWERDYYEPVFEQKRVLQATYPFVINSSVWFPLVFRLTSTRGEQRRAVNLYLYDSGDSDIMYGPLHGSSGFHEIVPPFCRSHGIIFLLDPLQMDGVRASHSLLNNARFPPKNPLAAPDYLIHQLRDFFEWHNNLPADEKIKVPTAFVLSKTDILLPLVKPSSVLHRRSKHVGHLDLDDIENMSKEIESYVSAWGGPNVCSSVHDDFAHYHYFGTSSLGGEPDSNGRLGKVSPFRVEDPFLWILYELGLIDGKRTDTLSVKELHPRNNKQSDTAQDA